ncbi:MAG: flagellar hook-associated protein FlgK [Anaeromyxobacter sp.]|nr:flagellar hook-associated protein FlgK [Anaeromyxobacter sp.]
MSDLLAILSQGAASLAAQRAAAATASHNLQNANTPGYARQRATVATTLPADRSGNAWIGRGSVLQGISQARDRFLEAQIPAQLGLTARAAAASAALGSVSALDPNTVGNLGDSLSNFYAALRASAQSPADAGLRQAAVTASRSLALGFQRTRGGLEEARAGVDAQLAGTVVEVNGLAQQVADLNGQVRTARVGGAEPNDLLDARQKAVDRLAELTGVAPVATSEGDVSLFLPGGSALVSGLQASTLATQVDPANGGHLALRLVGASGAALAFTGVGGELGGALDARDGALRAAVTAVDTLAWDLASRVNAVHQAGYGLDGTTGDALFTTGATLDGAAARLEINALVLGDPRRLAAAAAATGPTSAAPGDATNLQALIATERAALGNGLDAVAGLAKLTSDFGAAARSASALAEHEAALTDNLVQRREAVSGVSIDEELIELQKAQKAFEAISKVIQVSSEMFDTLLSLK